jgi:hypothetical protein
MPTSLVWSSVKAAVGLLSLRLEPRTWTQGGNLGWRGDIDLSAGSRRGEPVVARVLVMWAAR